MAQYQVNIDPTVFNDIYYPYLTDVRPIQIFFGGASSGKSVFFAQRCIFDLLCGNRNYLIAREVAKTIRGSVAMELQRVISAWGVDALFNVNKTDSTITCENGYQAVFVGLDDVQKLKSIIPEKGVFTDAWCEEATEMAAASIGQILKRQRGGDPSVVKRLMLSFNPILQTHWIYTAYFKPIHWSNEQTIHSDPELLILKTTYKDNKFLTEQDIARLENEKDKYLYNVYTLGLWGQLGHTVFTNWRVADLTGMRDQFTNLRQGLDFGFSSDPAASAQSHYDKMRKQIYIFKELYECGLTNDKLAVELKRMYGHWDINEITIDGKPQIVEVCNGTDIIVADSAEPKSIEELLGYGVNVVGARKGKDSVEFGIQWLQQHEIIVDQSCINMRNELQLCRYKEDAGGNPLKTIVDRDNHLIDQLRYAHEDDMLDYSWSIGPFKK